MNEEALAHWGAVPAKTKRLIGAPIHYSHLGTLRFHGFSEYVYCQLQMLGTHQLNSSTINLVTTNS